MSGRDGWAARIGAAFSIAILTGFALWVLGSIGIFLSQWLPVWIAFAIAGPLFLVLVIGDWVVDAFRRRETENYYERERRRALARPDDEL